MSHAQSPWCYLPPLPLRHLGTSLLDIPRTALNPAIHGQKNGLVDWQNKVPSQVGNQERHEDGGGLESTVEPSKGQRRKQSGMSEENCGTGGAGPSN